MTDEKEEDGDDSLLAPMIESILQLHCHSDEERFKE